MFYVESTNIKRFKMDSILESARRYWFQQFPRKFKNDIRKRFLESYCVSSEKLHIATVNSNRQASHFLYEDSRHFRWEIEDVKRFWRRALPWESLSAVPPSADIDLATIEQATVSFVKMQLWNCSWQIFQYSLQ